MHGVRGRRLVGWQDRLLSGHRILHRVRGTKGMRADLPPNTPQTCSINLPFKCAEGSLLLEAVTTNSSITSSSTCRRRLVTGEMDKGVFYKDYNLIILIDHSQ